MSERMTEEQWAMLQDYLADTGFASQEEEDLFAEAKHARASESALREERDDWKAKHGHESEMRSYVIAERDELQAQVDALREELERVRHDLTVTTQALERDAMRERLRILSAFARTTHGRLPQRVRDALASWESPDAVLSFPPKETPECGSKNAKETP